MKTSKLSPSLKKLPKLTELKKPESPSVAFVKSVKVKDIAKKVSKRKQKKTYEIKKEGF